MLPLDKRTAIERLLRCSRCKTGTMLREFGEDFCLACGNRPLSDDEQRQLAELIAHPSRQAGKTHRRTDTADRMAENHSRWQRKYRQRKREAAR